MGTLRFGFTIGFAALCWGQAPSAPVLNQRGAVNAVTLQPAPSNVSPGGLLLITGINLGPVAGFRATTTPLPTSLEDPPLEVRINNRPAPIFEATPGAVTVQVPLETPLGAAQIVVRRGTVNSAPARVNVVAPFPSLRTANGQGFGAGGSVEGGKLRLSAAGLGLTEPRVNAGELPGADEAASPRQTVRANVGGIAAEVSAKLSAAKVGEFEIELTLPEGAKASDVVAIYAGNAAGNRVTLGVEPAAAVEYLPLPEAARAARGLAASDLRPGFLALSAPRNGEGCWPSWVVDFARGAVREVPDCPAAANQNAASPFQTNPDSAVLAAFAGPATGPAAQGVSDKLTVLNPAQSESLAVTLPARGINIGGAPGGNLNVVLATNPPSNVLVNPTTGEVSEPAGPGGGGQPGGGGGLNLGNLQVDLGDDVKQLVAQPVNLGQGAFGVLAVDNASAVTRAKFGVLNAAGAVQSTRPFPETWLPLLAPVQTQGPGLPGGILPGGPGGPGGGLGAAAAILRGATIFDGQARVYWVLARNAAKSADAFIGFALAGNAEPIIRRLAEGTFIASCTAQTRLFNIDLSRRIAVSTGVTPESEVKNPCSANAFAVLDLAARTVPAINLPGQGEFSVSGNSANEMSDYVYGTNADPGRQNRSDTIYVLDGVGNSTFRLDLPPEIATFNNLTPIPEMTLLVGQASAQGSNVAGGAGLVIFDIENQQARLLPTPAGFAAVQLLATFPVTRKLLARGTRTDPAGSQLLLYDLVTGDLQILANPPGVNWVGQVPNAPGTPGQPPQPTAPPLQHFSPRSNAVHVLGYGANRQPAGMILVRVN
ncbi:MAG: hypothetical protein ACK527_21950 [Acidobacteriota bacterium]